MDKKNIQAILPLTPLQEGFLWHSIESGSKAGLVHMRCRLTGELNAVQLQQSWAAILQRHAALRTSVHWRNVKQPVQVVQKTSVLPWATLDHRQPNESGELAHETFSGHLHDLLGRDFDVELEIDKAPVFQITLIRLDEHRYELVWTSHHLLLDGWSCGLVLDQVLEHYDRATRGLTQSSFTAPQFADYLRWLNAQDQFAAQRYWSDYLAGFSKPTPLPIMARENANHTQTTEQISLSLEKTVAINDFLRHSRLTLNALMQGTWAILLGHFSKQNDVVFGNTISGRQSGFRDAEKIVGMLINVLPVRIELGNDQTVLEFLLAIQSDSFASVDYAFADSSRIQAASECPGQLYSSLLVVENQPAGHSIQSLTVSDIESGIVSAYSATIIIKPLSQLTIALTVSNTIANESGAQRLLKTFELILDQVVSGPHARFASLDLPNPQSEVLVAESRVSLVTSPPIKTTTKRPTNLLQAKLKRIWEQVLGVPSIDLTDSFFDLGGTSLLAMALFNRIEQEIGQKLPPTTLFETRTVAAMVELLNREKSIAAWSTIVEIKKGGDKPPLFIIDTATDLLIYRHLADRLEPDQAVYGFRARGMNHLPMDEVAAQFTAQMQAVQAQGPYFLGGMSGAGSLSWVIAQQLQAKGHKVGLLILFDCLGPDYPQFLAPLPRLGSYLKASWREFTRLIADRNYARRYELNNAQIAAEITESPAKENSSNRLSNRLTNSRALFRAMTVGRPLTEKIVNLAALAMIKMPTYTESNSIIVLLQGLLLQNYRSPGGRQSIGPDNTLAITASMYEHLYSKLAPYTGSILYFRAQETEPGMVEDSLAGWQRLIAGKVIWHSIPGSHVGMMQGANATVLATILTNELAKTRDERY